MRRIAPLVVWTAAVTTIATGIASAQELVVGLKAGVIGARIAVEGMEHFETSADPGAAVGVSVGFELGSGLRLQPEALYTDRHFGSSSFPLPLTIRGHAVEIPVLLLKRFQVERRVQPVLFAGPQISVIAKVTQTLGPTESDVTRDLRGADFGLTVGGGIEARAGRGAIVLDLRANVGFRDLSISDSSSTRSRAVVGLAGYRF